MEGVPFQNLKLTCIQKVIPFEPMASRKLAHRDLQEGFETVQGTALAALEGATYGANYLDLKKGDRILVFPESTTEGWVLAKKGQDDGVEIGWIPSNYYELANTTSSFEPRASRNLAHRDFQEGFETVQGTVLAAFEGATHGANYLDLKTGDRILVFPESTTEGWVLAKKGQDDGVEIGWIPSNYYELANTTSSSCFFNSGDLVPGMAAEELEEKGDPAQQHEASRAGTCGSASCTLSNNHESGHAPESLVRLAEGLKAGMPLASDDRCRRDHLDSSSFVVKKVWFNSKPSEGYFGIYWFCTTASSHFRLHCTIAKWDVEKWATESMVRFNTERVDFNNLKAAFDKWVRDADISARLLSWQALDVYKSVERKRDHNGWRIIMEPRPSNHMTKLYDIRKGFENMYEIKDCNDARKIHYSLDEQT